MRTDSTIEVAKKFVYEWVLNYEPPVELLSDNGGCLVSRLFQEDCNLLSVNNVFTKTYHHQSNWQVERYILSSLTCFIANHPLRLGSLF